MVKKLKEITVFLEVTGSFFRLGIWVAGENK
jgi:hypothetical protein